MGLDDRDDQRDSDRPEDRPEDREDETDAAIRLARCFAVEAVQLLRGVAFEPAYPIEERVRAAIALLEVSGCL